MGAHLQLAAVSAGYTESNVIENISLDVPSNSVTALLGRNGVGKTTTLRTIVGRVEVSSGTIRLNGEDVTGISPHEAYSRGIGMVTESRDVFPDLTVNENIIVPVIDSEEAAWSVDELYDLFPTLSELRMSEGKNLSGGEQQMLAIARALRPDPDLLLLDEPSEGLAPQIVEDVASTIEEIAATDTTVMLVEQNVNLALDLADYAYFMESGGIVYEGDATDLQADPEVLERYLGVTQQS